MYKIRQIALLLGVILRMKLANIYKTFKTVHDTLSVLYDCLLKKMSSKSELYRNYL